MPHAIEKICKENGDITGFFAPGHVAAVTGSEAFSSLAKKYGVPFCVAGFSTEHLINALYTLLKNQGKGICLNEYREVVSETGNERAKAIIHKYFKTGNAPWRGLGKIDGSGLYLKEEYSHIDAGSRGLESDKPNVNCKCPDVLTGKARPADCPLFGKVCTPLSPVGACMVSEEGSCNSCYMNE